MRRQELVSFGDGQRRVDNFVDTRDHMLGPQSTRGPARPSLNRGTGQLEGGTAFERSGNAHPVASSRAYTIGLSYEKPTQLLAPAVGNKGSPSVEDGGGLRLRNEVMKVRLHLFLYTSPHSTNLNQAAMDLALHGCHVLPQEYRDRMEEQASLVNAPRMGTDDNACFFTAQVNLSNAVSADDGMHASASHIVLS